jgi:dihydroorotase
MKQQCDLLIRNARIFDPVLGIDEPGDIAVSDGKIAAVGRLDRMRAKNIVAADGATVLPGLIDFHCHVFEHVTGDFGINADLVGVRSGVTAVVDQGGPSAITITAFRKFIAEAARTRTYCFVSTYLAGGMLGHKYVDLYGPWGVDANAIVTAASENRDLIKGIKAHAEPGGYSRWKLEPLRLAVAAARELKLPVYVHLGTLWSEAKGTAVATEQVLRELEPLLAPGDILAHPFTRFPSGVLTREGKVHPIIRDLFDRGIRFDVGRGSHISFNTARRVLDSGIMPFTVGADLHGYNIRGCGKSWYKDIVVPEDDEEDEFTFVSPYSLQHAMTEMLALGVSFGEVVKMASANCAAALKIEDEFGSIAVGGPANLSIVDVVAGRWTLKDSTGVTLEADRLIQPRMAIRDGEVIQADSPLLPDLEKIGDRKVPRSGRAKSRDSSRRLTHTASGAGGDRARPKRAARPVASR